MSFANHETLLLHTKSAEETMDPVNVHAETQSLCEERLT